MLTLFYSFIISQLSAQWQANIAWNKIKNSDNLCQVTWSALNFEENPTKRN